MTAILLTGASGYLGQAVQAELRARGASFRTAGRSASCDLQVDLARPDEVAGAVGAGGYTLTLNLAAMPSVAGCAADPDRAHAVNARAVAELGRCAPRLIHVSTDMVFGGDRAPYRCTAAPDPRSVYGASKARGEEAALAAPGALVLRLPLLFGGGAGGGGRGATAMLRKAIAEQDTLTLFVDEFRTPLHVADAARGIVDYALDGVGPDGAGAAGVRHLAGPERISRFALAERFRLQHDLPRAWRPVTSSDPNRPRDVSMLSDRICGRDLDAMLRAE